jgi:hypothetical protein
VDESGNEEDPGNAEERDEGENAEEDGEDIAPRPGDVRFCDSGNSI